MKLNKTKILLELERLGWTQTELAKRMGSSRQLVNRHLLSDESVGITLKTIDKMADAMGLDPKDLIK
jgi:transcriptional regulator with XRE-family HTH domain